MHFKQWCRGGELWESQLSSCEFKGAQLPNLGRYLGSERRYKQHNDHQKIETSGKEIAKKLSLPTGPSLLAYILSVLYKYVCEILSFYTCTKKIHH